MSSIGFLLSFLAILLSTVIAGVAAKRSVRGSSDFSNAGSSLSAGMVAGALVGGFVGGTSIVGTGELAYQYGLSAIWFTMGGGVAVMLLGVCANRFIRMRVETLPELIGAHYGSSSQLGASIFLSVGMFIQVIAQLLAALPFVSVFWKGPLLIMAFIPACLIFAYVLAGGFMGASIVGSLKTGMLILLLFGTGGWLWWLLSGETYVNWWEEGRFSLVVSEAGLGWAQGAAMIIGIFSTQAYLQPIFASRNAREARTGAITAGVVILMIGLVSAWIGLYMHDAHPGITPREAVPQFFLLHSPDWLAGAAYAIILLSVVMTGAALTLSIATILNRDVLQKYTSRFQSDGQKLALSRWLITGVILLAYLFVCLDENALILHWAFLAMTLRGVTVFLPVMFFLFQVRPVHSQWAAAAIWGAPVVALLWTWTLFPITGIDPLYVSGLFSLLLLLAGRFRAQNKAPSLRPLS
ncbi:sodium:solute symporter family protein [Brevibacillus ruminantium]|uniref:Sodium:solute symporter family protein n=1 Tax=Brevibacillus ruminantium TaxID=2950604 RepID=A0ABY4WAU3_9BACL|nr:sodium:solute symporter family protein [Brevibacillus ruminantium]USG64290.1 sodium:solute symporter family protein [Brevibacillus ruminantium]